MSNPRSTVLILASDPAFAREITAKWPEDHGLHSDHTSDRPEFVVLDEAFSRDLGGNHYDLAIADVSLPERNAKIDETDKPIQDSLSNERINHLTMSLAAAGKPAIVIHSGHGSDFYTVKGAVVELRREPGVWAALAGLLGREILRRRQAEASARESETLCATAQAEATLGRYMVEMRTNVNNALTTVLGNAELLVLEPGLPATVLAQSDSIRNMALRLHEIFQRFSSLEKELKVAARESGKQAAQAAQAAGHS
ncbi:MAG TPA: hypothetical protein VK828_21615 [Terriglobales bacterium]|jgi:hypothetical protein|nr:hypothetical protein [Terriglobales bacterium]